MNNIYLLKLNKVGYDEFDGWVVIAKDEEEVIKLCDIKETEAEAVKLWNQNQFKANIESIKLIGKTKLPSQIVLGSYNAG